MNPAPTLAGRIMANDLRLYFRAWQQQGKRRFGGILLRVLFIIWVHAAVYPFVDRYSGSQSLRGGVEFACLFVGLMLLTVALQRSLDVLYNRGDLALLLASPAPRRVVVITRLASIVFTTWLSSGLMMLPLLNVTVWLHGPQWLWAWVAWLIAGLTIVPCALLATVLAVRFIGARRARIALQIGSVALGLTAVAGLQAPNWMHSPIDPMGMLDAQFRFFARFDQPWLNVLAEAARGDLRWLTGFALTGAAMVVAAFQLLQREFVHGAQMVANDSGPLARPARATDAARSWRGAFAGSRSRALLRKEFRLLRRDPLLLLRASTQLLSLLPALAVVIWQHTAIGVAAFALLGPPLVSVTLGTMMTLNDEAHVFVASSPLSPRRAAWARTLAAAFFPALLALACGAASGALGEPLVAVTATLLGVLNAITLAWAGACAVRPLTSEDRARNRNPRIVAPYVFAMFVGGLGVGGISALVFSQPIVGGVLLVLSAAAATSSFILKPKSRVVATTWP